MSNDMIKRVCILLLILGAIWIYRMELFNLIIRYEVESEIPTIELKDAYWINEEEKIINS